MKLRDRALILLLIYSGLRRSEAANVKRGDIVPESELKRFMEPKLEQQHLLKMIDEKLDVIYSGMN